MSASELDIIDSLTALQYRGKLADQAGIAAALNDGIKNPELRELLRQLAEELHILRKTDERISVEIDDVNEFTMELSSMLKELGCPFYRFVTGPLSERFDSRFDLLQLLDYLLTELMATKMSLKLKTSEDNNYVIPKSATHTAISLERISKDLQIGKPPANVSVKALFDKLNFKVEELLRKLRPGVVSEPLLVSPKPLSKAQWEKLENICNDLDVEYNLRREVLLTRLKVTIESFQWSASLQNKQKEISDRFEKKMKDLYGYKTDGKDTDIIALLAARSDLAIIEKTSSANVRKNTASKLQKHVIGSVPDRGGRAHEHAPPPPEMPSWQQQRSSGPARGGGGASGRGGGGNFRGGRGSNFQQQPSYSNTRDNSWASGSGRVQGTGWSPKNNDINDRNMGYQRDGNRSNNYQNNGGGENGNRYRGTSHYNRGGGRR